MYSVASFFIGIFSSLFEGLCARPTVARENMEHPITFEFEINIFFSLKKYVPNVAWMKYSEMSAVVKVLGDGISADS